jgi:serine/threonine-protein kinase
MTTDLRNLEIVRPLGVGGMATVYLARVSEGSTSRHVAVKKPHAFLAEDPASAAVIEDEAQLAACIRHPNVVRVLDFVPGSAPGEGPALVMEWIEGVDLGKLVQAANKAGRRLPIDVVAAIARDVLAGLHAAHESRRDDGLALDIIHRDVSPQNVLVGFDGVVRVTDFGVAKAASRLQQQTEAGSIKGKLAYLAPEQLAGRCDRRVDIYGAGVIVWELLTGTRMRGGDGLEMLVEIMCSRASAPSTVAPDAACLDAVVMRALEHREEDRFATAEEMLQAIERRVTAASPARVAEIVRELMGAAEPAKVEAAAATTVTAATIVATLRSAARASRGSEALEGRRVAGRHADRSPHEIEGRHHAHGDPVAVDDHEMVDVELRERACALLHRSVASNGVHLAGGLDATLVTREVPQGHHPDWTMTLVEDRNRGDAELHDLRSRKRERSPLADVEELRVHDFRNGASHAGGRRKLRATSKRGDLRRTCACSGSRNPCVTAQRPREAIAATRP